VTHSKFGFYECTQKRLVSVDSGRIPGAWWYPYDWRLRDGFPAIMRALYSPSRIDRFRSLFDHREEFRALLARVREMGRGEL
jgi:hypothetical protein